MFFLLLSKPRHCDCFNWNENLLTQWQNNGAVITIMNERTFAFELGVPGVTVPPGMMVGSPMVGWVVAPLLTEIGLNDVTDD